MKKLLAGLVALFSTVAFGATTLPVQLLNPAGSTSGWAPVSTGPTTSPTWAAVNAATLNGLTFANPGPIGGTTPSTGVFTNVQINEPGSGTSTVFINAPSDASGANLKFTGNGASTPNKFIRVNGGVLQVMNSAYSSILFQVQDNGDVSASAMDNTPIGSNTPSTGAFTTLSATSTVTIPAGQTLPTPNITGVTSGACAAVGSVGECPTAGTGSGVSFATATPLTCASVSLAAGDYLVWGDIEFVATGLMTSGFAGISQTNNTLPAFPNASGANGITFGTSSVFSVATPMAIVKLTTTTTVYLVGQTTYSSGAVSGTCSIWQVRFH